MFKKKVYNEKDKAEAARKYYNRHKKQLDAAMGSTYGYSNEDIFADAVASEGSSVVMGSDKMADIIQKVADSKMGLDDEIRKAKREAENRHEAGFDDLRKLNKRMSGGFITYDMDISATDHVEGYYDIKDSDYVLAKVSSTKYSTKSPMEYWSYLPRIDLGL